MSLRASACLALSLVCLSLPAGSDDTPPAPSSPVNCPDNAEPAVDCASGASDAGAAPTAHLPSVSVGNPISLVTGNKTQTEVDLEIDGALFGFKRHYASAASDANVGLGNGWRHTFAVSLAATVEGGRRVVDSTGRHVHFDPDPDDPRRFKARLGSDGDLSFDGRDHVWSTDDGRRLRFRGPYLIRIDWPGHQFVSLYYRGGRVVRVVDETGRRLALEYTPGRIGLHGYAADEFRSHAGHLAAIVLPDATRIEYDYDERQNLTRARYADGTARRYHYENADWREHLTGITDRTGARYATWGYDDAGRADRFAFGDGSERVSLRYEMFDDAEASTTGDGHAPLVGSTTITNASGAISTYRWRRDPASGASLLLSATGPGCTRCPPTGRRYDYDGNRLVLAERLASDGRVLGALHHSHDADGRLVRTERTLAAPDGTTIRRLVERRAYDDAGRLSLRASPSVNPAGETVVQTVYDEAGLPTAFVERGWAPVPDERDAAPADEPPRFDPIERRTALAYEAGRLITVDGPRDDVDDVLRIEYDERLRPIAIHPPAGPTLRIGEYDEAGRPDTFGVGGQTPYRLERDDTGRVTRIERGGERIDYRYDAEGRLLAITDVDGRTVSRTFDAAGRLVSTTDDAGRTTTIEHDPDGRPVSQEARATDGTALRTLEQVFGPDRELQRVVRAALRPGGTMSPPRALDIDMSDDGHRSSITDPTTGSVVSRLLDPLQRIASIIEPSGARTDVTLDVHGRQVALRDARGNVTHTVTDDFGRVVLHEAPDTGRVRYAYDAAGNRTRRIDAQGRITDYRWDAADRLIERRDVDGTTSWRYEEASGTLLEARNDASVERFAYDADARLVMHTRELDGHAFETRYTYDERGRIIETRLPDGQTLRHHYHDSGPNRGTLRAVTRARWHGLSRETVIAEIDADPRDGSAGYASAGGVRAQQRFAPNGELLELSVGQGFALDYRFDASGRIVGIDERSLEGTSRQRFGYDAGRLSVVLTPQGDTLHRYDPVGNRVERIERAPDGAATTLRYRYATEGNGNRLLRQAPPTGGPAVSYSYDASGAPLQIGELVYRHDAQQRPVEVSRDGALIAHYAYNAFGERIKKTVYSGPGATPRITYYLYDGNTLSAEADDSGAITAQYLYLDGHRAVAKLVGREIYGIHGDHLGTPRLMIDADGDVVWRADVTPFGETTIRQADVALPLRLPGQYADAETGTHYNYLRDYDPATGRYLTSDPIGLAGGVNGYAYALSNPMAAIDPTGLLSLAPGLDPAYTRWLRDSGLRPFVNDATRPGRIDIQKPGPGTRITTASRGLGRVLGIARLFTTAYAAGYEGARLIDQLIIQPRDHADLVASIQRYDTSFVPATLAITPASIRDLSNRLEQAMFDYLQDVSGDVCPVDPQLDFDTRYAVYGPTLEPSAMAESSLDRFLRQAYADYRANGGTETLEDWLAAGMPTQAPNTGRGTDERWLLQHNTQVGVRGPGRSIAGAHNLLSFEASAAAEGMRLEPAIEISPGVYEIEYQVPELTRAGEVVPGEYRTRVWSKTVYDPSVHSDAKIARLGAQAGRSAVFVEGRRETVVTVGGFTFRVYRDLATGAITNAHII